MPTVEIIRNSRTSQIYDGVPLAANNGGTSNYTFTNLGTGSGIFKNNTVAEVFFKTIIAGNNIELIGDGNTLTINSNSSSNISISGLISTGNADLRYYSITNPSGFIINSGFALISYVTGVSGNLQNQITLLNNNTGNYYLKNNPSGYITGFNSGIYITTGQTGQFYPASNPNNYSTSGNLQSTGNNLQNQINNITNITGNFYLSSNPSGYITGNLLNYATNTYVNTGFVPKGRYNSISINAGAFAPLASGGATASSVSFSNTHYFDIFSFDPTSDNAVTFQFSLPDVYNNGSLKSKLFWGVASGGISGVVWGICGRAYVSGDSLNQSFGPETLITGYATNSGIIYENVSNYINLTGTVTGTDSLVLMKITRKVNDSGDLCNKAAYLYNSNMQWKESIVEPALWS